MSSNRVALRAYRALLTQTRAIRERGKDTLTVRLPVVGTWGHGQTYHGSEKHRRSVERYLGDLAQTSQPAFLATGAGESTADPRCAILLDTLSDTIRDRFRAARDASGGEAANQVNGALRALRVLSEQTHLLDCTSESVTEGVHVEITSTFLGRAKERGFREDKPRWQFTYRAQIRNAGTDRLKVIGRSWSIHNEATVYASVPRGSPGVVGCTPILNPGDYFEYHSGTDLDTMRGFIKGSFQMVVLDQNDKAQRHFDAIVEPFRLIGNRHPSFVMRDDTDDEAEIDQMF